MTEDTPTVSDEAYNRNQDRKRQQKSRAVMVLTCITILAGWVYVNVKQTAPKELVDFPMGIWIIFLGSMGLSNIPDAIEAAKEIFAKK
jgi:hypothetical protein